MTHNIHVFRHGQGEVVNLLHGWGMNAAVFEPLAVKLEKRFQVNRIDLPGYGRSGVSGLDFDAQVEQLADAIEGGTLIGWSMGGLFAMALARRYPHKYRRLMLIGCNPCFVEREDWPCAMQAEVFNEFGEALVNDWQTTIRRFIGLQMHGADNARGLIRQITALLIAGGNPSPQVLRFGLQLLLQRDDRQVLSEISVPLMVVLGRRDKLVPSSLCDQLSAINPAIAVECLPRSAHAPFLSHQQEFLELLHEFVESSPAG